MLCTKAGHARPLLIPARGRAGPAATADDRWALVARLLHEDTIDFTDRVAALLLSLYGQQLSRIAAMTTGHEDPTDSPTHVGNRVPQPCGVTPSNGRRQRAGTDEAFGPWLFSARPDYSTRLTTSCLAHWFAASCVDAATPM